MENKALVLETVQHSKLPHIDDVEQIGDKDYEVLNEIKEILCKHNYTDRFGITLLHKHFELENDEILLEETDEENRTQKVYVEKKNDNDDNIIETMWKFGDDIKAETICVRRCSYFLGHKNIHKREKV